MPKECPSATPTIQERIVADRVMSADEIRAEYNLGCSTAIPTSYIPLKGGVLVLCEPIPDSSNYKVIRTYT